MVETDLHTVPGWSPEHVERLGNSWITSAEQVVAICATTGGLKSLAQQLNVSEAEAGRLVESARGALSPEQRHAMDQPFDSDERGLGARHPAKEGEDTNGNQNGRS